MEKLLSLLENIEYTLVGNKGLLSENVTSLSYNSADVCKGAAFFCLAGARADGHDFAHEAYKNGARVFFCEHALALPRGTLQIIVENSRLALARTSAAFFRHPEKKLALIAVTGTKGKSTVCEMISHIFTHAGKMCATVGTLGIKIGAKREPTENSTPESFIIYKALAEAAAQGAEYAVLEVSSQALCTHRVEGLRFAAAVFTNLSRDHIGAHEHPSFEHYKSAKKSLFSKSDFALICADDAFAEEFAQACACPFSTYGTAEAADIRALGVRPKQSGFGVSFLYSEGKMQARVNLSLPGDFSALNALAAIAVCRRFGVPLTRASKALESAEIRGRLEYVPCARRDITCIIDYAHNGISLEKALATLRAYARGRIICLFGSVGGRTRERRRGLAEAAARGAEICIVTSDNPDFEDPSAIIEEIASYIPREKCFCIADRAAAISAALNMAESGDFLLFAGKGHEEYQLVCGKKLPFSERELIKNHIFKNYGLIPSP
ncbi:MAG: UDP-N-acetylmuramoyl-L-alanyl-D-glutamate--2,6-diaminopimelate ligase [Clostridia bacterium]|nr:UDP-N-acetylmuramoyl-L-alanyl-D-glutamate--2,6-diaminopimelate ligase [Clostridia bacterium]